MPLFALPLNPSIHRPSSHAHHPSRAASRTTKRKRVSFTNESTDYETDAPLTSSSPPASSSLAFASTNPLALTPDEVQQYRVAGLPLDQELPSKSIPDFPHRGLLPDSFLETDGETTRDEEDNESRDRDSERSRGHAHLRIQHLGVLTGILHRCLLSGDIPRAGRAWAMLLRAEVNGKSIDLRGTGYWGVGAELLVRDGEVSPQQQEDIAGEGSDDEHGDGDNERPVKFNDTHDGEVRWGTAAGLAKAKEYYQRLILQHPYKNQFSSFMNSLDFWPAMLGCEIYGIQYEQNEGLRKVAAEEQSAIGGSDDESFDNEDLNQTDGEEEEEDYIDRQQRREHRKLARIRERTWQKRDEIRRTTLLAAEQLAVRMDELMTSPPYSDSPVLHRLRGMLALYVGDLSVPALLQKGARDDDDGDEEEEEEDGQEGEERWFTDGEISERKFIERKRRVDHERGLVRRAQEIGRARKAFENVRRAGGRIEDELARLPMPEDSLD